MNTRNVKTLMKLVILMTGISCAWSVNINILQSRTRQSNDNPSNYDYASLVQQVNAANNIALQDRIRVTSLYNKFLEHKAIGIYSITWLHGHAYANMTFFNPYNPQDWNDLLAAVDVIPTKLVLQQAALYSQNGTGDLAQHANNLFNILIDNGEYGWRDAPISATTREANWLEPYDIQYAKYYAPLKSVTDYMWIINTSSMYTNFRNLRVARHKKNLSVVDWNSPELLAITKTSPLATDSLYGNAILPPIPYSTI